MASNSATSRTYVFFREKHIDLMDLIEFDGVGQIPEAPCGYTTSPISVSLVMQTEG